MRITSRICVLVLLATSVAGCTLPIANSEDQLDQVGNRFPIRVEPQVATLVVPVGADGSLQTRDGDRVRAFADVWKQRGYGLLGVSSEGPVAPEVALRDVRNILTAANVTESSMRVSSAPANDAGRGASVSLTFMTDMAVAASCEGNWTQDIGEEPRNLPYQNYACATSRTSLRSSRIRVISCSHASRTRRMPCAVASFSTSIARVNRPQRRLTPPRRVAKSRTSPRIDGCLSKSEI